MNNSEQEGSKERVEIIESRESRGRLAAVPSGAVLKVSMCTSVALAFVRG
jgi:hypothetical protein